MHWPEVYVKRCLGPGSISWRRVMYLIVHCRGQIMVLPAISMYLFNIIQSMSEPSEH